MFPPILASSQPAFYPASLGSSGYVIYFTLSDLMTLDDIKHIQIKITKQSNNQSIVRTSNYPDGIIYKPKDNILGTNTEYYIAINPSTDLNNSGFQAGEIYKIQMRFGKNAMWTNKADFTSWKATQVNESAFSEWSTVMLVKVIDKPQIEIKNATKVKEGVTSTMVLEPTLTPLFIGYTKFTDRSKEIEDQYRFILYSKSGEKLEDSGWLQHNASADNTDIHRFSLVLENYQEYTVIYQVRSINGYTSVIDGMDLSITRDSKPYNFRVQETYLTILENTTLTVDDSSNYAKENGCVQLYLDTGGNLTTGNLVITRSCEDTNFTIWEDLKYILVANKIFNNELIFTDFTIESGIKYKYAIQKENSQGLRTSPLFEENKNKRMVNFEYSYLFADEVQIPLKFNTKLSSFKHTVLANKIDTLGSKYPTITRNGDAYYAEFPITGLISFNLDSDQTFFKYKTNPTAGYYYKDELIIPDTKFELDHINARIEATNGINSTNKTFTDRKIDNNLTDNNIFIERKFREKVEEFLNNGEAKLFKSPTEGNIIVSLMNISLTPEETLGRMIYNFSATAYEIIDYSIENLDSVQIIDIGILSDFSVEDKTKLFGQINGMYIGKYEPNAQKNGFHNEQLANKNPTNLLDVIKEQMEYNIGDNFQYKFYKLDRIWIEQYPKLDFQDERNELAAQIAITKNNTTLTEKEREKQLALLQSELDRLEKLAAAATNQLESARIGIYLDNNKFLLGLNKPLVLKDVFNQLKTINLEYSGPIILNYTCEVYKIENTEKTVTAIDSSIVWGQIEGVFTKTHEVLRNYNYLYESVEEYQIPNLTFNNDVVGFTYDNTNYDVYKDVDIFDIIKEKTRKKIQAIYNINEFTNYDEDTDTWDDGTTFYQFQDVTTLDIEADKGTQLELILSNNDTRIITIGTTERYILRPFAQRVKGIKFLKPTFAIINYTCSTMQTLKGVS